MIFKFAPTFLLFLSHLCLFKSCHPIPTLLQLSLCVQSCIKESFNSGVAPYVFYRRDDIGVGWICDQAQHRLILLNAGEGGDIAQHSRNGPSVSAPLLTFFTPLQQIQVHYRWCFCLLAKKESQKRLPFLQPWCGSPCKWLIACLDCHLNNTSVLLCAWHFNAVMLSGRLGLFVLNFCERLRRSAEMRVAVWNVCLWRRRER